MTITDPLLARKSSLVPLMARLVVGASAVALAAVVAAPFGPILGVLLIALVLAIDPKHPLPDRTTTSRPHLYVEAVSALAIDPDPASALDRILKVAVRAVGAKAGFVMVQSEDGTPVFSTRTHFGEESGLSVPDSFGADSCLFQCLEPGRAFVQHATEGSPRITDDGSLLAGSLVALPLSVFASGESATRERVCVGVLVVLFSSGMPIDKDMEEDLMEISTILSLVVAPGWHQRAIQRTLTSMLETLVDTFEIRSEFSRGHSKRVSELVVQLGKKLGLGGESLDDLRLGGLLHDIGKIAVPESILNKPGELSKEDISVIREHPVIGYEMCRPVGLPDCVLKMVRNHHENLDGNGYPDGLSGADVTLYMRIVAVADSFDAMCSRRAYREPMRVDQIVSELTRYAGTQFDPVVVEKLKELLEDEWLNTLYEPLAEMSRRLAA